ncbi:MAG TPA: hypothetical protein VGN80_03010 [Devosiaceae bacterium]|nr:hypothetical protein [Devosiaceae bacterium]
MNKRRADLQILLERLDNFTGREFSGWDFATFQWFAVCEQARQTGDLSPVVTKLRSGAPLSEEARSALARLLEGQKLPERTITEHQWKLLAAASEFYEPSRNKKADRDLDIAAVADRHEISEHQLQDFIDGKGRTSQQLRRLLRRL